MHGLLVPLAWRLWEADSVRRRSMRFYRGLYEEVSGANAQLGSFYNQRRRTHTRHEERNRNIVAPIVNAAHSIAMQSPTRVMFVTDDGSTELQAQAEQRQDLMDREFLRTRYQPKKAKFLLHACLYGSGVLRPYRRHDRPAAEVVDPWNLVLDERDARAGEPRCYYERLLFDKEVLAELFPDEADAIDATKASSDEGGAEFVTVWQAYRLPSGPDADDGRHVVCVGDATLLDVPYEHDESPYVVTHWREPADGFWGIGIPELVASTQVAMTGLEEMIEAAEFVHGFGRMWAARGSVKEGDVSNEPGKVNFYDATSDASPNAVLPPPTIVTGDILSPVVLSDRQDLQRFASIVSQVSESSVTNTKPAGVNSAKGIRLQKDIENALLVPFLRSSEWVDVEVARRYLWVIRDVEKDAGDYVAKHPGKKPVSIGSLGPDDEFDIKPFPVSALSTTPAGRLEDAQDMISSGLAKEVGMSAAEMLGMIDSPDLKSHTSLILAPHKNIRAKLDRIVNDGVMTHPTPCMPPDLAMRYASLYLNRAECEDPVDEDKCERLRTWIAEVERLAKVKAKGDAANQPPPPPGAPPLPPDAGGMPPPDPNLPPGPVPDPEAMAA